MSYVKQEKLSALIDDALDPFEASDALDQVERDPELRAMWDRYHLIGDAMRGEPLSRECRAVADRVARDLDLEPHILTPRGARRRPRWLAPAAGVALAASVAMVAMFMGPGLTGISGAPPLQVAAVQPTPHLYQDREGTNWNLTRPSVETKLNSFLVNHQEYAPASGMKGMLPYTTFVSYDVRR